MSSPYVGQIEFFAFGFAPNGWQLCAGQTLPINQYQALFSLLGTTYGGNGINTFQLPDLRSRVPVAQGNGWVLGQTQGQENHTLTQTEIPAHTHLLAAVASQTSANTFDTPGPTLVLSQAYGDLKGPVSAANIYAVDSAPSQAMSPQQIGTTGGQPHNNLMPYLVLNACIAMNGLFPSRS
jgi:microcystin-dependent protein